MREIKFRGKRVDNDNWVYGCYIKELHQEMTLVGFNHYIREETEEYARYLVSPNTISQYTGLKDKNGVEIYEGDKVKAKFYGKEVNGEIGFSNGCFLLWNSCVSDNQLFIFSDIEVIGNIYDNKELLKEEGK